MSRRWIAALALAAQSVPALATAATIGAFTSFHVLGDSLSDAGNVYRTSFHQIPESPPYWHGRFSNGPVWADRVVGAFRDEGLPTGNHAWGGAKALSDSDGVPDLRMQAARYLSLDDDRRGDRPMVALFAGGNDIIDAAGERGLASVGRSAARAVGDTASLLRRDGVRDFLLFTLPDIGAIPKYRGAADDARAATRGTNAFNRELDRQIAELRGDGARVRLVDTWGLFEDMRADPRAYGVRNTRTPCLDADDNPCSRRQARNRAFFDRIHPNRVVHRRISETALAKFGGSGAATMAAPAAVPLPASGALLAAALLCLAGSAAYQRSRRRPSSAPMPASSASASPYQLT